MVERTPFSFELPGATIAGDAWIPPVAAADRAVVVCHGFKGFKDWGFFPTLCETIAERTECRTVGFNFDGSGVRGAGDRFDDLESFARNTFTRESWDLEAVLDRLSAGRLGEVEVPPASKFALLGHSRGGATCLLKAAARRQVESLITWASIASVERYADLFRTALERDGTLTIPNARTGQDMPLHRNILEDFRAHADRLDVLAAARAIEVPYLIVHGSEDESVPVDDARALARASGPHATLCVIDGAGHTFGARHPWAGSTPHLEQAIEATIEHLAPAFAS